MGRLSEQIEHVDAEFPAAEIVAELERAERKFPNWPLDPIHGMAIVMEEAGEAQRATMHFVYENGPLENLRKELIQTAAMAVRFLTFLDRTAPQGEKT